MDVEGLYDSLKIENIVASGRIAEALDIEYLSGVLDGCVLNKKKFPGAVYHMKTPEIALLLFSSGKIVMTGISNKDEFQEGLSAIISQLQHHGIETLASPDVVISNMVCSYDSGDFINLNKVVLTLSHESVEYEPEQFPGLVYRIDDPKVVALLFSSGKFILTGAKNLDDVKLSIDYLSDRLRQIR
ncbi:TATA-box-binding protein [Methanogenium organophilum]|uniref:TATA-box-binding protein n=1 Tax=Methanogenium organophilum TaxID=2199 RepID=A0A9X9T6X5_METOG|nr:TATA-box-binding protein [Methanogenium organophilum]WAI00160.1 TATA-box-binding protein [Methanogenium organophilum]